MAVQSAKVPTNENRVSQAMSRLSPNNRVQRAVLDKVQGRGRINSTPNQVMHARVLNELRPVADAGR
jgi:hypothetical protein